jgi:PhzF family phenazine biosynthesis protein
MTVDVFTSVPYRGNPLAVVLDGTGLDEAQMQAFAAWTNLSETTFVLPPTAAGHAAGADYRVRIFTPGGELPFAGHPTLGSCHAWLAQGGVPQRAEHIVQECAKGLVSIQRHSDATGERLAFAAPTTAIDAVEPALVDEVAQALGVEPQQILRAAWLDNGPRWMGVLLASTDTVLALEPDHTRLKALNVKAGVCALYEAEEAPALIGRSSREARAFATGLRAGSEPMGPQLEVRGFAAPVGVNEDPVTGSLNAGLGLWLRSMELLRPPYLANQGCCVGRDGQIYISEDDQAQLWVGGHTVTCIQGQVLL